MKYQTILLKQFFGVKDIKISSFRAKAHLVFHWCLHNKTEYLLSELVQDDLGKIAPNKYG